MRLLESSLKIRLDRVGLLEILGVAPLSICPKACYDSTDQSGVAIYAPMIVAGLLKGHRELLLTDRVLRRFSWLEG